jgi:hypothetical protein
MINLNQASLTHCIIHKVGNKYLNDSLKLSDSELILDDELATQLTEYFLKPFKNNNQAYSFYHNIDIKMNDVYACADNIFENENFIENSINIVKHLYDETKHPSIKEGEIFIAVFDEVIIENTICKGLGIFKSETKDNFFKINEDRSKINILIENGINQKKLDKGCFIFNNNYSQGFDVFSYEHNNSDTAYWKDEFLKLKVKNDNYNQTNNLLGVYKNFVTKNIDTEFEVSKTDKIDLLNRSMKYFKEKESFELDDFNNEVIGNEQGIASFLNYKKGFEDEFETPIPNSFDISAAAVKKQTRVYKSVLKLDKNFHIYIHGDKQLIEKGFDEDKHMNYYKVYFKEEQ